MRTASIVRACLAVVATLAAPGACSSSSTSGGGADCTSLCSAAQSGNCTSIKGNCSSFCAALGVVKGEASCGSQYDAYESCLGTTSSVCSQSCGAQQSALQNCVAPYCSAHSSEGNCTTLAASY